MSTEFDRHTRATPLGEGRYAVDVPAGWSVGGGVNGGFLLALMVNALRAELPERPDPLATSAHFLSATTPGPGEVRVVVRREGGSVATAQVELSQDGVARISATVTCGDLDRFAARSSGPELVFAQPLELPPIEECFPSADAPQAVKDFVPMLGRFDLRLDPAHAGWGSGEPGMEGIVQSWFRLNDEREPDVLALLVAVDVLPPVTFDLGMPGWAPTLELTAHVRRRPVPGWLRVRHATRMLVDGLFEEDAEVWDSADRLVAQSRQLAMVPRPMS